MCVQQLEKTTLYSSIAELCTCGPDVWITWSHQSSVATATITQVYVSSSQSQWQPMWSHQSILCFCGWSKVNRAWPSIAVSIPSLLLSLITFSKLCCCYVCFLSLGFLGPLDKMWRIFSSSHLWMIDCLFWRTRFYGGTSPPPPQIHSVCHTHTHMHSHMDTHTHTRTRVYMYSYLIYA